MSSSNNFEQRGLIQNINRAIMEMDGNGWTWMEMDGNGWKWMEMDGFFNALYGLWDNVAPQKSALSPFANHHCLH